MASGPVFSAIFSAALLFLLPGCDEAFRSHAANSLDEAEKKVTAGDYNSGIALYEAALGGNENSAEIHYRLALIYDEKLKQPLGAMHHFQRYLELAPKGSHVKEVRGYLKEDQVKLITSLTGAGFLSQEDAVRLKNDNLALRKQLTELRAAQRAAAQAVTGGSPGMAVQKPIPADARTYIVEPGDTLASISKRFFKTPGRWKDIQDANFNTLSGTVKLKPGMTLIIP